MMLQQTQVPRVVEKYRLFLKAFPTFRTLASAATGDVLKVWQGLGYNRRALMLQRCARQLVEHNRGILPKDYERLKKLPGIGPYTANAILAFAFDEPITMIETNIRRVYLHHFFVGKKKVADTRLLPLIARDVLRVASARQWYSALMDYGTYLATVTENPNRRSKQYTKQKKFQGSLRQLRGKILRHVAVAGEVHYVQLVTRVGDSRAVQAITALQKEGFLHVAKEIIRLVA